MDKALVQSNGNAPAVFGTRSEIAAMRDRIVAMMPGASKLSKEEQYALAQIAVAHSLNPFNGEVWAIPGKGTLIGVKGLRKKAHEQVRGSFWIDYREITDEAERKRYRIEPGALAFEARLYDSENIRTYTDTIKTLMDAHIPWEAVEKMIGTRPYTSGIGVLKAGEQTRMEPVQCARKRAESNALKQRFDVPFGVVVQDVDQEDVEVLRTSDQVESAQIVDGDAEELKNDQAALFGQ